MDSFKVLIFSALFLFMSYCVCIELLFISCWYKRHAIKFKVKHLSVIAIYGSRDILWNLIRISLTNSSVIAMSNLLLTFKNITIAPQSKICLLLHDINFVKWNRILLNIFRSFHTIWHIILQTCSFFGAVAFERIFVLIFK